MELSAEHQMGGQMKLGLFVSPGRQLQTGVERARLAEDLGYTSSWVIQVGDREATIVAAAIAAGTSKIEIGTGVLPAYPRTVPVMAQTAATLDELSGGRFILGLGPSHKITIELWHGMKLDRPLTFMREYVGALRAIMQGGSPPPSDMVRSAFAFMGYQPLRPDLPIYLSCLSPKMCRLTGEIADGAILWMCAPRYIEDVVVPAIAEGRAKAGKTMEGFEIVSAVPLSLTTDKSSARDGFRKVAITYWSLPFYRAAVEGAGLGDALAAFDSGGPSAIPDEAIDQFTGIGDEQDCLSALERYRSAGVTSPAVSMLPPHEGAASPEELIKAMAPR